MNVTVPDSTVELLLDRSSNGDSGWFTLNRSRLGGPDRLAGPMPVDVRADLTGFSFRRGRSRVFDPFETGDGAMQLRSPRRAWDPEAPEARWPGEARPWRGAQVSVDGRRVFTGYVADWNYAFTAEGFDDTVSPSLVDELAKVADLDMTELTVPKESTSDRVHRVLDAAGYPTLNRAVDGGHIVMPAGVIEDGTNVLAYLQDVARAEQGGVFADRDGRLRFANKLWAMDRQVVCTISSDGDGVTFDAVNAVWGSEWLSTRVMASMKDGHVWSVKASQEHRQEYGDSTMRLLDMAGHPDSMFPLVAANYWLRRRMVPRWTVSSLTVDVAAVRDGDDQRTVVGVDLGDWVRVIFRPGGFGRRVDMVAAVQSVTHDVTDGQHSVTFELEPADTDRHFRVGVDALGGSAVLAP